MPKIGEKTFDIRLIERFIHQGDIKHADHEKYLKSLPDDAEHAVETRPGDVDFEAEQEAIAEEKKAIREAANQEPHS